LGPFLGFLSAGGDEPRPIAVLPRRGGYAFVDSVTGERRRVTRSVVASIQREAYVFYRPLPSQPLGFTDLMRSGMRDLQGDLGTLILISLLGGVIALLTPFITRHIVDSSIARFDTIELVHLILVLAVGAVAAAVFQLVRGLTVLRLRCRVGLSLQAALWDRLISLPVPFFRRFSVGDISSRAMGIEQMTHIMTSDITGTILTLLSCMVSLGVLFYFSVELAVIALALVMVFTVFFAVLSVIELRHLRGWHHESGRLQGLVHGLLSGIVKLRVVGAERRAFRVWAEHFIRQRAHSVNARTIANVREIGGIAYGLCASLIFYAAVGLLPAIQVGVGDFLAFIAAFAQFQTAAIAALAVIPTVLGFIPIYERMKPILVTTPEVRKQLKDPGHLEGTVELRNISFRYQDGHKVLDGVTIRAEAGEFIAIVGPSGSGKTTCLRLLLGFEQPEAGDVLVDDQPLTSLNPQLVRRQFGVVLQDSRPMVGTIFHNIAGSLALSIDDVWHAIRLVGLEEEIRALPMNIFTHVDQRGASFSGGQRQRLLLARALVNRPRVLLLDEATSALDNQAQEVVARSLTELGTTRVLVAHRVSTVYNADRIYVLDHGHVVEQGRYDELVRREGLFARIARRQRL
jgi:ATP-binding cassette subfamily C protein